MQIHKEVYDVCNMLVSYGIISSTLEREHSIQPENTANEYFHFIFFTLFLLKIQPKKRKVLFFSSSTDLNLFAF